MKEADAVLRDLQISSMRSAADVIVRFGATHPAQWPDLSGRTWRKLEEVQLVRHRLAHGFDSLDPRLIRCSGRFVLAALEHRDWLECLPIRVGDGAPIVVGDLLARQVAGTRQSGCDEASLRVRLNRSPLQRKMLPNAESLLELAERLSGRASLNAPASSGSRSDAVG